MHIFSKSLICLAIVHAQFVAAAAISDQFTLNGFGTLGLTNTNAPDMGYRTSLDTDHVVYDQWNATSRSLVGVQANYR